MRKRRRSIVETADNDTAVLGCVWLSLILQSRRPVSSHNETLCRNPVSLLQKLDHHASALLGKTLVISIAASNIGVPLNRKPAILQFIRYQCLPQLIEHVTRIAFEPRGVEGKWNVQIYRWRGGFDNLHTTLSQ
nr:hypothetical protein [Ralstonia insidiosa]